MKDMYQFLLNMWLMNRIDESYLSIMVTKGFITQKEKEVMVATPKILG